MFEAPETMFHVNPGFLLWSFNSSHNVLSLPMFPASLFWSDGVIFMGLFTQNLPIHITIWATFCTCRFLSITRHRGSISTLNRSCSCGGKEFHFFLKINMKRDPGLIMSLRFYFYRRKTKLWDNWMLSYIHVNQTEGWDCSMVQIM